MSRPVPPGPHPVSVRFDNMVEGVLEGGGIDPARFARAGAAGRGPERGEGDLLRRFRQAVRVVRSWRAQGRLGFLDLPRDRSLAARTLDTAAALRGRFDNVVVVGIGGSALGAATLRDALLPPGWNELGADARGHRPRLYLLDNPDPDTTAGLLGRIDLSRTLFNVVSKSGSTAETLAHLLVIRQRLEDLSRTRDARPPDNRNRAPGDRPPDNRARGDLTRDNIVVTTGPDRGFLRHLADKHGLRSLPVPANVGGRFSVLSPVGLLPAALAGIDTTALLEGAAEMAERCEAPDLLENPAGILAVLLHLADTELGAGVHVFMPYADRLRGLTYWLQQLWAESLGKAVRLDGTPAGSGGTALPAGSGSTALPAGSGTTALPVGSGPTPLPAFGATDQHSLLQLFMEGPRDKVVVFIARGSTDADVPIPRLHADSPQVSHLGGRTLFELLDCERIATAEALRRTGRPNMTVAVDRVDARSVGGLFMLFQIAVVYAGALYGVDPMDQPGVELGKALTGGLTGRPGCERPILLPPDPRWQV